MGNAFGASGLFLGVSELDKFGQLCLQNGRWNGRQLIPEKYLREAGKKQVENDQEGYGYLFWRGKQRFYRADGMYGQFSIVLPDKEAVITTNAECRAQGELLDCLLQEIAVLLK